MWTDVLQASGAVLGALLTGGALLVAALTFRHDVRSRNREVRDAEAAQARLILFRFRGSGVNADGSLQVFFTVVNESDKSIRSVMVEIVARGDSTNRAVARIETLSAGAEHPLASRLRTSLPTRVLSEDLVATVRFEDAAGLVWERTDNEPPKRAIEAMSWRLANGSWLNRLGTRRGR